MAHFAKINEQNIVEQVIVADEEFINSGAVGDPNLWLQTSYNTHGGVHSEGGKPFRKNYAGIGFTYDEKRDAFIPPQPYSTWILNEKTCLWEAPNSYPQDGQEYFWNESIQDWDLIEPKQ